jgi:SAM-dependent methyltransferase
MPELRAAVARAVVDAWGRLDAFNASATDLAKRSPALAQCLGRVMAAWPQRLSGDALWTQAERAAICADPLLRTLMESAPICDIDLEHFLTSVRRALLVDALAAAATPLEPLPLAFYCTLARQNFINEYVYVFDEGEAFDAERLRERLQEALAAQADVPALWLAAVGAYRPLHELPGAAALAARPWPPVVAALIAQQITEPFEELRLRATIPALTAIDHTVSIAVRNQYEENPYPRWAKLPIPAAPDTPEGTLRTLFPSVPASTVQGDGCDVLIAGCGTGHCAIEAARRYLGARVLAVDLSLTSLAYAKRKTRELGIANIDYQQADVLRLGAIDCRFDVIEAGGVLQCMDDPSAGWKVLLDLLRPGGFLYLGLYSEIGRQQVVAARTRIEQLGYRRTASDIRRFRDDLVGGSFPEVGRLWGSPDFFSMSNCRDLCFHVQEYRHTIPQIKAFIEEQRLTFLGFVIDPKKQHEVEELYPGEHDLDRWHCYEVEHPNTFSGMYNFWMQKPR